MSCVRCCVLLPKTVQRALAANSYIVKRQLCTRGGIIKHKLCSVGVCDHWSLFRPMSGISWVAHSLHLLPNTSLVSTAPACYSQDYVLTSTSCGLLGATYVVLTS
jgi:hypothetical protein